MQCQGKHTAESHANDSIQRGFTLQERAAIHQVVRANPLASGTEVRRNLGLQQNAVYVSPTKGRAVARLTSQARAQVLERFTGGKEVADTQGALTRICKDIFLKDMIEEHNRPGGKHLELHAPVCLGYQFQQNVVFAAFTTPYLVANCLRSINSGWPLHLGFDSTGGLSSTKFDTIGVTTNSLRNRANPVCWSFCSQESAVAYECTYDAIEGGNFLLLEKMKFCNRKQKCLMCDSIREQREEADMQQVLTPPRPKKKKRERGEPEPRPHRFKLPLAKPLCDNTTKFSKFINKRLPHLKGKVLQCAAHLTGIAWQKRLHRKYFKNQATYKKFYKLLVQITRSSSVALSNVLQRKLVQWLYDHGERVAGEWVRDYWSGERGNYTKAHAGVGVPNNNNGVEGRWRCMKPFVTGTSGATGSLSLRTVLPSTLRFIHEVSKEQASRCAKETRIRCPTSTINFSFPRMPLPISEDWNHLESLHPWSLELAAVHGTAEAMAMWRSAMDDLYTASEVAHLNSPPHERIAAMHEYLTANGHASQLPGRTNIAYLAIPRVSYLKLKDPEGTFTLEKMKIEIEVDMLHFCELMENPAEFEARFPAVTLEHLLFLHESFVLIEPLSEKWGRWVISKCGCQGFFAGGICGHSLLLAMLYDRSLKFPPEDSSARLARREKKGRRPNAWAPEDEDVEECPSAKQHWCPVTVASEDMIIRTLSRTKQVLFY